MSLRSELRTVNLVGRDWQEQFGESFFDAKKVRGKETQKSEKWKEEGFRGGLLECKKLSNHESLEFHEWLRGASGGWGRPQGAPRRIEQVALSCGRDNAFHPLKSRFPRAKHGNIIS